MLKIALIGNSHAAALKQGWEIMSDEFPDVEITFFSSGRETLGKLTVEGRKLVTTDQELKSRLSGTSDGLDHIDSQSYDAFYVIGGQKFFPEDKRLSLAVKTRMTEDGFKSAVGAAIVLRLRQITQKPIWFSPNPLKAHFADHIAQWKDVSVDYQSRIELLSNVLSHIGATVFEQPKTTRNSEFSTDEKFARANEDVLSSGRSGGDRAHMNAQYGAIFMRDLIGQIASSFK